MDYHQQKRQEPQSHGSTYRRKNCEITPAIHEKIVRLLTDYKNADPNLSKAFPSEEFGYYLVDILRPLRLRVKLDENVASVQTAYGTFEPDNNLKDNEQIPLTYEGGIDKFFADDIKPFVPDVWMDNKSVVIGYEITFTKYFYKPAEIRSVSEIISDLQSSEYITSDC